MLPISPYTIEFSLCKTRQQNKFFKVVEPLGGGGRVNTPYATNKRKKENDQRKNDEKNEKNMNHYGQGVPINQWF